MDIQLPGMDGLEATALLKGDPVTRAIPVIALTALAMKGDEERIRAAGCDGYIAKPIGIQDFLAPSRRTSPPRRRRRPPSRGRTGYCFGAGFANTSSDSRALILMSVNRWVVTWFQVAWRTVCGTLTRRRRGSRRSRSARRGS